MRKSASTTTTATEGDTTPIPNDGSCVPRPPPPGSRGCKPASWPFNPGDASPLSWWRTLPSDHLGDAEYLLLREVIGKIGVLKGREWVAAMRGDAAASIDIALAALPIGEVSLEVDLAMTVLMLTALGGNAAAAPVLSQVLRRAALDHPFAAELSASWQPLNSRRATAGPKPIARKTPRTNKAVAAGIGS